jgi:hypothetical protein
MLSQGEKPICLHALATKEICLQNITRFAGQIRKYQDE